jgi:sugar/nucleoside kinase (ribokinase family)
MACVKLDAEGAVLATRDRMVSRSAPAVEPVDPTGAGDAFDGVLLASLARGAAHEDALGRACAAGAAAAAGTAPWPE